MLILQQLKVVFTANISYRIVFESLMQHLSNFRVGGSGICKEQETFKSIADNAE